uniref:Uncharacterized protein n=1 Tax=Nelumbo nucifera TaxID=4432 RepID=A0A822Z6C2_NELNU|nr:TPA_asm: hypothetical protein HUJ06_014710 [Nelumbo nucifera]
MVAKKGISLVVQGSNLCAAVEVKKEGRSDSERRNLIRAPFPNNDWAANGSDINSIGIQTRFVYTIFGLDIVHLQWLNESNLIEI